MRFTGLSFHQSSMSRSKNEGISEIEEIVQNYKITTPKLKSQTRMKWRSPSYLNP